MLLQKGTGDKIQLITGSAGSVDVLASWVDNNAGTIDGDTTVSAITTAATTDIVAAPASSVIRNAKTINIRNKHASNSNTVTVQWTDGTTTVELFKVALSAGEVLTYVEGIGWVVYASDGSYKAQTGRMLFKALSADATIASASGVQPWFPSSGAVTVQAATTYFFEGLLFLSTGGTTHTTATAFAGTATLTSILYNAVLVSAASATIATAMSELVVATASSTVLNATSTAVETRIEVNGIVRVNAGGTFIPQFNFSANPTGTNLAKANSFFRMWPVGDNNIVSVGTWA